MSILSDLQIDKIMEDFLKKNSGKIDLTQNQIYETKEIFKSVMLDEVNINKNYLEQESLITDIAIGFSFGETKERIFRAHSTNKHMNFFDNFMEEGQASKIQSVLNEKGISTEVLRGIKAGSPFDFSVEHPNGHIEISGYICPSPDGENDENDFFEIKINGEVVYRWDKYSFGDVYFNDVDFYEPDFEEPKIEEPVPKEQPKTKSGKPRKGTYLGTIISSSGETITKEITSKGQVVHRDSRGRFAKK